MLCGVTVRAFALCDLWGPVLAEVTIVEALSAQNSGKEASLPACCCCVTLL